MFCLIFLFYYCWNNKNRINDFLLIFIVSLIMKMGCILILRFYLKSLLLDFEWKFDFLVVEYVIFENFMVV